MPKIEIHMFCRISHSNTLRWHSKVKISIFCVDEVIMIIYLL